MEEKLKKAASRLPQPKGDFLAVEEAYQHKQTRRSGIRKRRFAIILTAVIVLFGCVIGVSATAEVNHSAWVDPIVRPWSTVKREMTKLNYEFPKTLGESPFSQAEHMYFCPPGTKWLGAILKPSYKPTIITYGSKVANAGAERKPMMELMFGSALNKYCHQWWQLEEDYEPWFMRSDKLLEGTGQRLEYGDNILYTGTQVFGGTQTVEDMDGNPMTVDSEEWYKHHVLWVDTEKNVACCLESEDVELETLLEYVKGIIDLNKAP
jgi:hypothetical protein